MEEINPNIKLLLEQDQTRKWVQSEANPNIFRSNLSECLYVYSDSVHYFEKEPSYDNKVDRIIHEMPSTKEDLIKILTKTPVKKTTKKRKSLKSNDVTKSISDDYGNLLISKNNGKRIIVSLKLVKESKSRRIGVINIARKSIDMERNSGKHLFLKTNSYGFNHNLLKKTQLFESIRLRDEKNEWFIPVSYVLEKGHYMNFLNSGGFVLQIFVSLEEIEQFKRNPKV